MKPSASTARPEVQKLLPEDPWLQEVVSKDPLASEAWEWIVRLRVAAQSLETRLLELRSPRVPPAGFGPYSRKECERAVKRIERVAQDIVRFGIQMSDLLPGIPPPLDTPLGELLLHAPPGSQTLLLHDWLLHFVRPIKDRLKKLQRQSPSRSQHRARFPDPVHTIGAEIVHMCVVASSCAGLSLARTTRGGQRSPHPAVGRIRPKKWPGPPKYCYDRVSDLLNAVLAAEGFTRTVEARNLRRAYDRLHPRLSAVLKAKPKARKEILRRKIS